MDADKQAWLAKYATRLSHDNTSLAPGAQTADQISAILRDQFGMLPKRRTIGYTEPYPSDYDLIPLPPKYRLLEFTKFNGSEGSSSIEHVSRYLAQLEMISVSDPLGLRFFSQSLTGPAFGWYTSLGPDSIRTWKQLEEQFHIQYHSKAAEARIADLAQVRQKRGETVAEYIQRFREVKKPMLFNLYYREGGGRISIPGSSKADQGYGLLIGVQFFCTLGSEADII
jgi:hypothetical protein